MQLFSTSLMFLLVMDPLGNIPMFLTALRGVKPERRVRVVVREHLIALVLLLAFLFIGRRLLEVLHVTPDALGVGGGVVLLLIAVRMIFPSEDKNLHEAVLGEPLIVPMAVPYIAGPSMLATEILVVSTRPTKELPWIVLAVFLAWCVSLMTLAAAGWMQRRLGERVLTALERLMGMILVILSVQMLLTGLKQFFM